MDRINYRFAGWCWK